MYDAAFDGRWCMDWQGFAFEMWEIFDWKAGEKCYVAFLVWLFFNYDDLYLELYLA